MSDMPYMELEDLAALFRYSSRESALRAISRGTFPIPTYLLAGRRVADREVARKFFEDQRADGLKKISGTSDTGS